MCSMNRPRHRKSKNGCIECKKRHIKCDEKHPTCSNCSISERSCKYLGNKNKASQQISNIDHEPQAPATTSPQSATGTGTSHQDAQSPVNMLHIELLQFFNAVTLESLKSHNEDLSLSLADILQLSLSAPYLMNQILALAALHASHVRPSQQEFYYLQATQLQTHAVSIFNNSCPDINSENNCLQVFFFSSTLGMHMLCDALTCRDDDDGVNTFLDRFVRCVHLQRGVRIVTKPAMSALNESSTLRRLLTNYHMTFTTKIALGDELAQLLRLIERSKLGPALTKTYHEAIGCLQSIINGAKEGAKPAPSTIIAWPALVPIEYVDSLALHRPEALVILAYYAALLNLHCELWLFQDGGRFLIESITRFLGSEWDGWLEWPNRELHRSATQTR